MSKREEVRKALQHAGHTPEEVEGHLALYDDQQDTMQVAEIAINFVDALAAVLLKIKQEKKDGR